MSALGADRIQWPTFVCGIKSWSQDVKLDNTEKPLQFWGTPKGWLRLWLHQSPCLPLLNPVCIFFHRCPPCMLVSNPESVSWGAQTATNPKESKVEKNPVSDLQGVALISLYCLLWYKYKNIEWKNIYRKKETTPPLSLYYLLHLTLQWTADSLEETLMLGKIEGRRRGWQRMRRWMASPIQWKWTWADSRRWWQTGKPGVLQSIGSWKVGHDLVTEHSSTALRASQARW